MAARTIVKDPSAKLDYGRNWTRWLAKVEDELDESEWIITPPDEVEVSDPANNETITKVTLAGGVDGKSYKVTNQVTTVGGRTDRRTFTLEVRKR